MSYLVGIDIGGTKCAVSIGKQKESGVDLQYKVKFPTPENPQKAVETLIFTLRSLLQEHPEVQAEAIGISCGGPLDSKKGVILSPPNLPGWKEIDVVTPFSEAFGVPTALQNDANACALAEWLWGAGKGVQNMIFLTFGTGLGAGLILDGKLYLGTNDMAGEVGHVRLREEGPEGYGKRGSFEGFCSGGGIARYAVGQIESWKTQGKETGILKPGQCPCDVTTEDIGMAAESGDELALEIMHHTGRMLGRGVAMLIDILNPQKIVIGSIFLRQQKLLRAPMEEIIAREALSYSRCVCEIVPAGLGEQLGDYAALSVAGNLQKAGLMPQ